MSTVKYTTPRETLRQVREESLFAFFQEFGGHTTKFNSSRTLKRAVTRWLDKNKVQISDQKDSLNFILWSERLGTKALVEVTDNPELRQVTYNITYSIM